MFGMKNIFLIMLVMLFMFSLALPVYAETEAAETEAGATEAVTEIPAETEAAETEPAAETEEPVSDLSNIIGIIVAVVIGIGAIVAVILLAPRDKAPKRK